MMSLENYLIPFPKPAVISEKDRKYIELIGHRRILSEKEWFELQRQIKTEIKRKYYPGIYKVNPDFVRETFNEILKREKILVTNLKRVWNPFDWTHKPVKNDRGEYTEGLPIKYPIFSRKLSKGSYSGGPDLEYRFILVLSDPKELRNIKLRRKRRERRDRGITQVCKKCLREFQAIHRDKVFCSNACKMRDYRKRKKER
jgi:hypothetical protein